MTNDENLNKEINRFREIFRNECDARIVGEIANHFAEWGYLRAAEKYDEIEYNRQRAEESVPADLEEASEEWAKENYGVNYMDFDFTQDAAFRAMYHFQAGAKWQKVQLMKEAVEGFIFQSEDYYPKELVARYDGELKHGDKVRIIILPKED